jgi:hypothetical protein
MGKGAALVITIIDLEQQPERCMGFAPREKREQMRVGMFVRLLFTEPGRLRPERLWVKVMDVAGGRYSGEMISEAHMDIEIGDEFTFGPEHVCEWCGARP